MSQAERETAHGGEPTGPDELRPLADLDGEGGAADLDRVFGRGLSTWDPSRPTPVSTLDLERSAET